MQNVNLKPRIYGEKYTDEDADKFGVSFEGQVSLTKQSEADACDINNIMKQYEATGRLPDLIMRDPIYADFSDMGTYQEAMNIVAHANEQFNALDARVREQFDNDPAKFLKFAEDPKNIEALVDMGLATKREEPVKGPQQPAPAPIPQKADPE